MAKEISAFSPPEKSSRVESFLPGSLHTMSTLLSSGLSLSVSFNVPLPPGNSISNMSLNAIPICANVSKNLSAEILSISAMTCSRLPAASRRSSACRFKKSNLSLVLLCLHARVTFKQLLFKINALIPPHFIAALVFIWVKVFLRKIIFPLKLPLWCLCAFLISQFMRFV
jgi:hypothetical protein